MSIVIKIIRGDDNMMMTNIHSNEIRNAMSSDAEVASQIIRDSITQLCGLDHQNKDEILKPWLENKTPETLKKWIEGNPDGYFICEKAGRPVALGAITPDGQILLNYVSPGERFQGISKKILNAMEQSALSRGLKVTRLVSTMTAHKFYQSQGYIDTAPATESYGGKLSYPMEKELSLSTISF